MDSLSHCRVHKVYQVLEIMITSHYLPEEKSAIQKPRDSSYLQRARVRYIFLEISEIGPKRKMKITENKWTH